jgi:hypothetical protein
MPVRFVWTGLDELKAALRALPDTLRSEASTIVLDEANTIAARVTDVYAAHRDTGDLADHVSVVKVTRGPYGVGATVKSSGKISWLFDNGSQARHYVTASGADHATGQMWGKTTPPHTFVSNMQTGRREMWAQIAELLKREGLVVSGSADD